MLRAGPSLKLSQTDSAYVHGSSFRMSRSSMLSTCRSHLFHEMPGGRSRACVAASVGQRCGLAAALRSKHMRSTKQRQRRSRSWQMQLQPARALRHGARYLTWRSRTGSPRSEIHWLKLVAGRSSTALPSRAGHHCLLVSRPVAFLKLPCRLLAVVPSSMSEVRD